ncbi:MAG: class I SAM-dependent RNA methyltransferase [Bacteroidales bacterium]|nr:class I SAM-dependent RNA methyltransferase [Bacteroidales bacterium]
MSEENNMFRMIAKTLAGLEEVLAEEIKVLGGSGIRTVQRGVEFYGDKKLMYKANYQLRTALRIIKPIAVFKAFDETQLYEEVKKITWEDYLDINSTFSIDGITSHSNINHSKYLALKTKDALVDRFRELTGKRPNVKKFDPDMAINVRVFKNQCTVSVDSSGEPLFKRGYRKATGPAPLNEVLAAGMILLSGWDRKKPFIDPMCGSGTIPIEAALIAHRIPPGKFREHYTFQRWKDYDENLWNDVKQHADEKIRDDKVRITGSDWSGRVLQSARENVEAAGLQDKVGIHVSFFADTEPPAGEGVLIMNPPYGERIKTEDITNLYKEIGDVLKQKYTGYDAWIISSHRDAMKHVGLRPSVRLTLFNGPLECKFAKFEMYEGKKSEDRPDKKRFERNDKKFTQGGRRNSRDRDQKDFRRKRDPGKRK